MVQHWVRFNNAGEIGFGTLDGDRIRVFTGNMFDNPAPTANYVDAREAKLLAPVLPGKAIALWNNFHALGKKLNLSTPAEPLYFIKPNNTYLDPEGVIRKPAQEGKVVFEGELAIVIGKTATRVTEEAALSHVFGYTCINDVTHAEILNRDPSFAQWTRSKGFDTFCPIGPVLATGLDPATLTVRTILNGDVRQDYPISDMVFSAAQLVSRISHDMTLNPGDMIMCGTSVGVGSMKPGSTVEIEISGIGRLVNRFE
jgi:2-keto-4-pentenoate hydratase/2-oxohepta-3-ene-1,7-dioic acid hydratase in catechol pathway